jgi:hypothetical protein
MDLEVSISRSICLLKQVKYYYPFIPDLVQHLDAAWAASEALKAVSVDDFQPIYLYGKDDQVDHGSGCIYYYLRLGIVDLWHSSFYTCPRIIQLIDLVIFTRSVLQGPIIMGSFSIFLTTFVIFTNALGLDLAKTDQLPDFHR